MATKSFVLNQEELANSQQAMIELNFKIASGVCTAVSGRLGYLPQALVEATVGTAAVAILTQAKIDALLGSTNEVIAATAFGTTALEDNKTLGIVLDCGGQVSHVVSAVAQGFCPTAIYYTSYGTAAGWNSDAAITDAAIAGFQVYVTSAGNIAMLLNHTDLSKSTSSGHLTIKLNLKLK